ncbi:MAG: GHKL domain-containing protein [Candidatus Omnitrophica bacterium]|nr:GHKL domain-containing protein [Candidatus Omnitrophota bacterium]
MVSLQEATRAYLPQDYKDIKDAGPGERHKTAPAADAVTSAGRREQLNLLEIPDKDGSGEIDLNSRILVSLARLSKENKISDVNEFGPQKTVIQSELRLFDDMIRKNEKLPSIYLAEWSDINSRINGAMDAFTSVFERSMTLVKTGNFNFKEIDDLKNEFDRAHLEFSFGLGTFLTLKNYIAPFCPENDRAFVNDIYKRLETVNNMCNDTYWIINKSERYEVFGLKKVVAGILDRFNETRGGGFRKHFVIVVPEEPLKMRGNESLMTSVLCNLLDNAFRSAYAVNKDKAEVRLELTEENGWARIKISDNGPGVPFEILPIFKKPFNTSGGTGLGLTEARLVVENHKGFIDHERFMSQAMTFSNFIVTLPLLGEQTRPPLKSKIKTFALSEENGSVCVDGEDAEGKKYELVRDGKFVYKGEDGVLIRKLILENPEFDARTEKGLKARRSVDWWSDYFSRYTLKQLEDKREKINRLEKAYDGISFAIADPVTGISIFKTFFSRWYKRDIADWSYCLETEPFRHTGIDYYSVLKAFLENGYYGSTYFIKRFVWGSEDNEDREAFERLEKEGKLKLLGHLNHCDYFAVMRPGCVYREEQLGDGRVAVYFESPDGKIFIQLGKGADSKIVIWDNRVTYNATDKDLDMLAGMGVFGDGKKGVERFNRLELGITKEDYIRYLREEFKWLLDLDSGNWTLPGHLLDICKRFNLDPVSIIKPVLDEKFPFSEEEEKIAVDFKEACFRHNVTPKFLTVWFLGKTYGLERNNHSTFSGICEKLKMTEQRVMELVMREYSALSPERASEIYDRENPYHTVGHYEIRDVMPKNVEWHKRYYTELINKIFEFRYPVHFEVSVFMYEHLESNHGLKTVADFRNFVPKMSDRNSPEFQKYFSEKIPTTSKFFRQSNLFEFFGKIILPDIARLRGKGAVIRALSVGCSYGCEPYGLAIMALENKNLWAGCKFEIVGVDVNKEALERAKEGIYDAEDVKHLPDTMLQKYFTYDPKKDKYHVKAELKKMVDFKECDVTDEKENASLGTFDVIFQENVLDKYEMDTRNRAEGYLFEKMLRPGGYITDGKNSLVRISKLPVEEYVVHSPFGTVFQRMGCCGGGGRAPLYKTGYYAQKLCAGCIKHTRYPGSEFNLPADGKLQQAINHIYQQEDKAEEVKLKEVFARELKKFTPEQIAELSFDMVYRYASAYKGKLAPSLVLDVDGSIKVILKSEAEQQAKAIDPDREKLIASRLWDKVVGAAIEAKAKNEALILGLDTTWIPEGSGASRLIKELDNVKKKLNKAGLDNVIFKVGKGAAVAKYIGETIAERKINKANIVILGGSDILAAPEFGSLRSSNPGNKVLLASVDPKNLGIGSGVPLVEMYLMALELLSGKTVDNISNEYIGIAPYKTGGAVTPGVFIFTPMKAYDLNEYRAVYDIQIKELESKA